MSAVIYGLKNCDTCRKAKKWFEAKGIDANIHDFRKDGLDQDLIDLWLGQFGMDALLNKRGTTWRALDDSVKDTVSAQSVSALMLEEPALMKRPIIHFKDKYSLGFAKSDQEKLEQSII